jgi:hypothetical protein
LAESPEFIGLRGGIFPMSAIPIRASSVKNVAWTDDIGFDRNLTQA